MKKRVFIILLSMLVFASSCVVFSATYDDLKKIFVTRGDVAAWESSMMSTLNGIDVKKQEEIQMEVGYQMYRRAIKFPTEEGETINPSIMSSWSERRQHELENNPTVAPPSPPAYTGVNWMSAIPDATQLNAINIPGTHDSATVGITSGPTIAVVTLPAEKAKTQTLNIEDQLNAGIRFFDLRVDEDGDLCHGESPLKFDCNLTLAQALNTINTWLGSHTTETVIIAPRLEDGTSWDKINEALDTSAVSRLSTTTTWTNIGSVRGKIVVACFKSGKITKPCVDFSSFPDNADLATISAGGKTFSISDQYGIGQAVIAGGVVKIPETPYPQTIDQKKNLVQTYLNNGDSRAIDASKGYIMFASAYNYTNVMGSANPITCVSDEVNTMISGHTFVKNKHYGWILMDFVTPSLAEKIWRSNITP